MWYFLFRAESPAFDVNSLFRAYNHIRAVALIHDIAVSLMGVGVVLIMHEWVGTGDEPDCL